jgi:hypothetical protein
MSKKIEYGVCIFFQDVHYYIPGGKFSHSKNGDIYYSIGDREKGGHISLHKSGEKHYRENDGLTVPLTNEDLFYHIIEDLKQLNEMTTPERKFVNNMRKRIDAFRKYNGCFNPNCKNRLGIAVNFDILQKDYIDYVNKHQKIVKQIWGEILDKNEEEDIIVNDKLSYIINKMDIEEIPKCKFCKNKSRITYNKTKKKYEWKKCPRCGGAGFDLEYLDQFRVDND